MRKHGFSGEEKSEKIVSKAKRFGCDFVGTVKLFRPSEPVLKDIVRSVNSGL